MQLAIDRTEVPHPDFGDYDQRVRLGFRIYALDAAQGIPQVGDSLTLASAPVLRFRAPKSADDPGDGSGSRYEYDVDSSFFPATSGNFVVVVENLKSTNRVEAPYELTVGSPSDPPAGGGAGGSGGALGDGRPSPYGLTCAPGQIIVDTGYNRYCAPAPVSPPSPPCGAACYGGG